MRPLPGQTGQRQGLVQRLGKEALNKQQVIQALAVIGFTYVTIPAFRLTASACLYGYIVAGGGVQGRRGRQVEVSKSTAVCIRSA